MPVEKNRVSDVTKPRLEDTKKGVWYLLFLSECVRGPFSSERRYFLINMCDMLWKVLRTQLLHFYPDEEKNLGRY